MAKQRILGDIQDAFDEMRRMYQRSPQWFRGPSGVAADRLVRLILARYRISAGMAGLLTRERLTEAALIVLTSTRRQG